MNSRDIAGKIRELRKSLRLTQHQFAELVGLSVDGLGKIERGVGIPTIDTISKIAEAVRIPVGELLSVQKKKASRSTTALNHLMAYMKTKSADDVEFVHQIAVMIFARKK